MLARDRERSGQSVSYVQSRICSHAQRQRAREVGSVSMVCAEQDLLARSTRESARGRVGSTRESARGRVSQYGMCGAGCAHTFSARERESKKFRTLSAREREGSGSYAEQWIAHARGVSVYYLVLKIIVSRVIFSDAIKYAAHRWSGPSCSFHGLVHPSGNGLVHTLFVLFQVWSVWAGPAHLHNSAGHAVIWV